MEAEEDLAKEEGAVPLDWENGGLESRSESLECVLHVREGGACAMRGEERLPKAVGCFLGACLSASCRIWMILSTSFCRFLGLVWDWQRSNNPRNDLSCILIN